MRALTGILLPLLIVAVPAIAQVPDSLQPRRGFWASVGGGGGALWIKCAATCPIHDASGYSTTVRLGGTLSSNLLIGGEFDLWIKAARGDDETTWTGSMVLLWYPGRTLPLFLKAGAGLMSYDSGDGTVSANAPTGSLGLGYEFRKGSNAWLTLFGDVLRTNRTDYQSGDLIVRGSPIRLHVARLGIGVTYH